MTLLNDLKASLLAVKIQKVLEKYLSRLEARKATYEILEEISNFSKEHIK